MWYQRIAGGLAVAVLLTVASYAALPEWIQNADYSVKTRLRFEQIDNENPTPPDQIKRDYWRYQLLLGAIFHPDPNIDVDVRLGTAGTSANGVNVQGANSSQNTTFDDAFRDDPVFVDRASITYRPELFDYAGASITGGKFGIPYSYLYPVWDTDFSLEGVSLNLEPEMWKDHRVGFTSSYLLLEEENQGGLPAAGFRNGDDAYMIVNQGRVGFDPMDDVKVDLWVSFYQFIRPTLTTRPAANIGFNNNSNNGLRYTSEFGVLDVGGTWKSTLMGYPFKLGVEWLKNRNARPNPVNNKIEDEALAVEIGLGKVKSQGDWAATANWSRVESDATLAAMINSDFAARLGQTNFEGFRMGLEYGVTDHTKLGVWYFDVEEENALRNDPDQQVIRVDFTASF